MRLDVEGVGLLDAVVFAASVAVIAAQFVVLLPLASPVRRDRTLHVEL